MGEEQITSTQSTENYEQNYDTGTETSEGASQPSSMPDGSESTYAIRVDPRTGRRDIVSVGDDVEGTDASSNYVANPTEQMAQQKPQQETSIPFAYQQQQPQQALPKYQSAGEVIQAMQQGNLDESRIPVEMAFQYAQFKQQQMQSAPQVQQNETNNAETDKARQEYFSRVTNMAKQAALRDIGLTEDELMTAEYSDDPVIQQKAAMYETAVAVRRNEIVQSVQAELARQNQVEMMQKQTYANVTNQINAMAANEPHFKEIADSMGTFFKTMPFDDALRYANSLMAYNRGNITPQQANDLQEYYQKARTAFYAKANGVGRYPARSPYVETSNNASVMQNTSGTDRDSLIKALRANGSRDYKTTQNIIGQFFRKR